MAQEKKGHKVIAVNRKARHDYFVDETTKRGLRSMGRK